MSMPTVEMKKHYQRLSSVSRMQSILRSWCIWFPRTFRSVWQMLCESDTSFIWGWAVVFLGLFSTASARILTWMGFVETAFGKRWPSAKTVVISTDTQQTWHTRLQTQSASGWQKTDWLFSECFYAVRIIGGDTEFLRLVWAVEPLRYPTSCSITSIKSWRFLYTGN